MNYMTPNKTIEKTLIDILTQKIQSQKLETDEEVFAFHQIILFLFAEQKKEEKDRIKLEILKEIITKQIFHSYQAIQSLLEEPEESLSKMLPFIYCFREYLEQKGQMNVCDEEKIRYLKEALLLTEKSPCRSKTISFCQTKKNEI